MAPLLVQMPPRVNVPPLVDCHAPWLMKASPVAERLTVWPTPALTVPWKIQVTPLTPLTLKPPLKVTPVAKVIVLPLVLALTVPPPLMAAVPLVVTDCVMPLKFNVPLSVSVAPLRARLLATFNVVLPGTVRALFKVTPLNVLELAPGAS